MISIQLPGIPGGLATQSCQNFPSAERHATSSGRIEIAARIFAQPDLDIGQPAPHEAGVGQPLVLHRLQPIMHRIDVLTVLPCPPASP